MIRALDLRVANLQRKHRVNTRAVARFVRWLFARVDELREETNVEQAHREAGRRRQDPAYELAFYLAHGCDHLSGFDDRTTAQRARMHRRERRWLAEAAKESLIQSL